MKRSCPFGLWPNQVGHQSTIVNKTEQTDSELELMSVGHEKSFNFNFTQRKEQLLLSGVQRNTENLLIYYSNIETLSNKMRELEVAVNLHKPDIIALTEVKPKNGRYDLQPSEIQIEGYSLYENLTSQGRGICIYVDNKLNSADTIIETYGHSESLWIEVKYQRTKNVIGCIPSRC